ncbi:MAG: hypothetical protein V2A73_00325 [Pseudomonadota bacterium]
MIDTPTDLAHDLAAIERRLAETADCDRCSRHTAQTHDPTYCRIERAALRKRLARLRRMEP